MYRAKGMSEGETQVVATAMAGPSPATTRRGRAFAGIVVGFVALAFGVPLLAQTGEGGSVTSRSMEAEPAPIAKSMVPSREDQIAAAKAAKTKRKFMAMNQTISGPAVAPQFRVETPVEVPAAPELPIVLSDTITTAMVNAVSTACTPAIVPVASVGEAVSTQLAEAPSQTVDLPVL